MIIPLQFILFQIITMLLTVMIEAYMFNWKFNINHKQSVEISCIINFISYLINWLYVLVIQWLLINQIDFKFKIMSYAILGTVNNLSSIQELYYFMIGCLLFNFPIIIALEFFGFNFASKFVLISKNNKQESLDFLNIIKENNAKKFLTILLANLYSYLATIIIFYLFQIKSIL
jgi:hypothetical protein